MPQLAIGLVLILVGSWLGSPPVVLLGLVLAVADAVRQIWVRWGLRGVEYRRRLPRPRGVAGEPVPLDVTVWNRKVLPLSWLRAEDEASRGVAVVERALAVTGTGEGRSLANVWTLAPYERVTRHFHVVAARRGVYEFGPAHLEAGDLFARGAATETVRGADRWLVRPRTVAVAAAERSDQWGGERRAQRGLIEDPTRYAGVRAYQPGDPIRSIHWRASARLGTPVSRLFEPGRHREVVLVLDVQTVDGPAWETAYAYDDDAMETLCVAAASLVRRLCAERAAVGLAASGYAGATRPFAFVPPGASHDQLGRCLDLLARLGPYPATTVERVLTAVVRATRPGTLVVLVTARDSRGALPVLRRLSSSGYPVQLIAIGERGSEVAARARRAGVDARAARLDGTWQTATSLVVA